jgi:hypothetical protein
MKSAYPAAWPAFVAPSFSRLEPNPVVVKSYERLACERYELLAAAKNARLMLYAWKSSRLNMGLGEDTCAELNAAIAKLEDALTKAEEPL